MKLKAFLINLSWNTDRLQFCRKEYSFLGDRLSVVRATEGKNLSVEWLESNTTAQVRHFAQDENYSSLNLGAIGCIDSHRRIWKEIAEGEYEHALVLEDDSFLCVRESQFNQLIVNLVELKKDFCLLGCSLRGRHSIECDSKFEQTSLVRILSYQQIGRTGGSYAYLISKKCAAVLASDVYPKIDREADDFAKLNHEHPALKISIVWPPVVHSSLFDTEIWTERKHLKGLTRSFIYSFVKNFKLPRLILGIFLRNRFSKLVIYKRA